MFSSLDALLKNGKSRTLQAIELEGGVGQQWRLWKWASYCASEVNSRVCFFLFEIVLHMFKNCSDFSLTSLLWYTHLELIVLFQKIAKQDGGRCEMAVYALQCSNLKHILPVCTDWEVCCDLGCFFL